MIHGCCDNGAHKGNCDLVSQMVLTDGGRVAEMDRTDGGPSCKRLHALSNRYEGTTKLRLKYAELYCVLEKNVDYENVVYNSVFNIY